MLQPLTVAVCLHILLSEFVDQGHEELARIWTIKLVRLSRKV